MQFTITAMYLFVCFLLVLVVLLQRGKDASGDLFGVGANAVLSSQGTTSFLTRMTSVLGLLFFLLSVLLGYTINRSLHENRLVNAPIELSETKTATKKETQSHASLMPDKADLRHHRLSGKGQTQSVEASPRLTKKSANKSPSRTHPKATAAKKVEASK